ncbi:MAG: DUF2793 domain-containing protein [Aestuariivirga sp.]
MAVTDYSAVLGVVGAKSPAGLIAAQETRGVYVVKDAEAPTALTPGNVTYIAFGGRIFRYDAADSTTANDGISCIVTADGKRFKSDGFGGAQVRFYAVQARTLTAPPGSPTIGQSWIVAVGGTGAWAGKDKYVASWTARGWLFTVPNPYDIANVIAENLIYNFSSGGSWVSGFPALVLGANSILPSMLKYGRFGFTVVNQTTNAPPGSPADGDAYIIGPTPTGVWATFARSIAEYESGAWVIYTPYNGALVYDASLKSSVKYDSGTATWVSLFSGYAAISDVFTAAEQNSGATIIANAGTNYAYSATTAPTLSNVNDPDAVTLNYTAKVTGAVIEVQYEAVLIPRQGGTQTYQLEIVAALFVDGASAASDWTSVFQTEPAPVWVTGTDRQKMNAIANFKFVAPDTSSHTYAIRFFGGPANGVGQTINIKVSRRRLKILERA